MALAFDGITDYLRSGVLNELGGGLVTTLACRIRINGAGGGTALTMGRANGTVFFAIGADGSRRPFARHDQSGTAGVASAASPIGAFEWHSIVGVFRNTDDRDIYIDSSGTSASDGTSVGFLGGGNTVTIGAEGDDSIEDHFDGDICDVAVWNRGLGTKEIDAYMSGVFTPPECATNGMKDLAFWLPLVGKKLRIENRIASAASRDMTENGAPTVTDHPAFSCGYFGRLITHIDEAIPDTVIVPTPATVQLSSPADEAAIRAKPFWANVLFQCPAQGASVRIVPDPAELSLSAVAGPASVLASPDPAVIEFEAIDQAAPAEDFAEVTFSVPEITATVRVCAVPAEVSFDVTGGVVNISAGPNPAEIELDAPDAAVLSPAETFAPPIGGLTSATLLMIHADDETIDLSNPDESPIEDSSDVNHYVGATSGVEIAS